MTLGIKSYPDIDRAAVAKDLLKGADWLEHHPDRWAQHDYVVENDDAVTCFCAIGASVAASMGMENICEIDVSEYMEIHWGVDSMEVGRTTVLQDLIDYNDEAASVDSVVREMRRVASELQERP